MVPPLPVTAAMAATVDHRSRQSLLYRRLLTERSWERAVGYAIVANVCSATVGLLLIDPLWRFIVSIS